MQTYTHFQRTPERGSDRRPALSIPPALAVIGSLLLLLSGCTSLPTQVDRTPSYAVTDTADTRLGQRLEPLLQANPQLSGFQTLKGGEAAFASRIALINAAEKSLDLQYYIWHDDLTGRAMYNQLLAAADEGVRVRLLLDDLDTAGKSDFLHAIDAHANIEIRVFNPFSDRDSRAGDFITDTKRVNHRMHNKTLTADNQATIFGGRNIGDEYFAADEELGFGDLDALAVGPIVQEVSDQFDLYWNSEQAYPLAAFPPDPPLDAARVQAFRQQSNNYLLEAGKSRYAAALRELSTDRPSSISDLDFVWSQWYLSYDQPNKMDAKQVTAATHLAPALKKGMDATQKELIIVSPYFVPGDELTAYFIDRVAQGVKVRILTNSLQANDVSLVHAGYMRYRKDLVAGGVELYEWKATQNQGKAAKKRGSMIGASRASLHAKFFGFDQTYIFIGSFNLDPRSVKLNTELGAYYKSPEAAKALSKGFDNVTNGRAYQVVLNDAGKIEWLTLQDGEEIRLDKEPDTTAWKRISTRLLSIIVPESLL